MRTADFPRNLTTALAVAALTFTSLLAPATPAAAADDDRPAAHSNTGAWLDTSDREAVLESYTAEFDAPVPDIGWTGSLDSCMVGTTNPAFRSATIDRVNWFRSIAGVPATITENAEASARAQEAAVMNWATNDIDHEPAATADFLCRTDLAATTAHTSNLYLGRSGPRAIDGYILDPGPGNVSVGHRNWILSPTGNQFGTGDVPSVPGAPKYGPGYQSTNVLVVHDDDFAMPSPTLREPSDFVAWPARGYVPADVVFERWSFGIRDAEMSGGAVTTEHFVNGSFITVPSETVHNGASQGAPLNTIVWEPALDFPTEDNDHGIMPLLTPHEDQLYRITVSGVVVDGESTTFTYEVIVIGDEAAAFPSADELADIPSESVQSPPEGLLVGDDAFTNAAFNDFLNRDALPTELLDWSSELASGTSRFVLVTNLTQREEWIGVIVDRMYRETLDRDSDAAGRAFWIDRVQDGMTVSEIAAGFYSSPEYADDGTVEMWIEDLYAELLGRAPDAAGLAHYVRMRETAGPEAVASEIYQSEESRRARVQGLYQELLGRSADAGGETYWATQLLDGDDLALAANHAASDEYYDNASR